jgi:hypothetical protein
MSGWKKKKAKTTVARMGTATVKPAAATAAPLSAVKSAAPRARRRGPPHALSRRLPAIIPNPPAARIVPRSAGVAKVRTRGVKRTAASSEKKFVSANMTSRAARPGRAMMYSHPNRTSAA